MSATSDRSMGGIVLCGGHSRRMGWPKALLPFGDEPMLARVVRLLRPEVRQVVVVAAVDQPLPPLDREILVVRDRHPERGPLEALAVGLTALAPSCVTAFVTSCDVPLLRPAFVRRLVELRGDHDAVVPYIDGIYQPLSAIYRHGVLPTVERMLAADRRRVFDVFAEIRTRQVMPDELSDVDPQLESLQNVNSPADYIAALSVAGLTAPAEIMSALAPKRGE